MSDGGAVRAVSPTRARSLEGLAAELRGKTTDFVDAEWPRPDDSRYADRVAAVAATFRADVRGIRHPGVVRQYDGVATIEMPRGAVLHTWKVGDTVAGCGYLLDAAPLPGGTVMARVQVVPRR